MKQKKILFAAMLVTISLTGCYERKHPMPSHVSDADIFVESQPTNTGRHPASNRLDIGKIRFGKHERSERLVFDVYKYDKDYIANKAKNPGSYTYKYNLQSKRIHLNLKGYSTCSALGTNKMHSFSNSKLIDKIALSPDNKEGEIDVDINLKRDSYIKIFKLKEPARIVVDVTPSS